MSAERCSSSVIAPAVRISGRASVLTAQTLHERTARFRTCSRVDSANATAL